jgi:hypothetical protein
MVIKMIKYIGCEKLGKVTVTTDIELKFEDRINKKQYEFIKDRLDNFNLDIDNEYSMTANPIYMESKEVLLIKVILTILDMYMPKDVDLNKIVSDYSNRFLKFYEKNIQLT